MTLAAAGRPFRIGSVHETMTDYASDGSLREMAGLIRAERAELRRGARFGTLFSRTTVAAIPVAVAVEALAMRGSLHMGIGTMVYLGLLVVLGLGVLRTATLMIQAERRLKDQFGELRHLTGAPVDPNVPWTPVRSLPGSPTTDIRDCSRAVLATAGFRNERIHLAVRWATFTLICFCAMSLLVLVGQIF
jgi:hypothetical protein